jgi:hypothetical protein
MPLSFWYAGEKNAATHGNKQKIFAFDELNLLG